MMDLHPINDLIKSVGTFFLIIGYPIWLFFIYKLMNWSMTEWT